MIVSVEIVQVLVLYVTVLSGVLLYGFVLRRLQEEQSENHSIAKQARNLTLLLVGVITMVFGVCCAHLMWPQYDDLWLPLLGILMVSAAWILYLLRKLSPKAN